MSYEDQVPGSSSFEFDDCPHNRVFWDEWVLMDEIQRLTLLFKYKEKPYHKFWDGHSNSKDAKCILEEHIGRMHVRDIAIDAPHTTSYFPISLSYKPSTKDTVKAHLSNRTLDPDGKPPARDPNLTFAACVNLPTHLQHLVKKKGTGTGTDKKTSTASTQSPSMKRSPAKLGSTDNVERHSNKRPRTNRDDPPVKIKSGAYYCAVSYLYRYSISNYILYRYVLIPSYPALFLAAITNLTRIPELTVPTSRDSTLKKGTQYYHSVCSLAN